jgi:universal stress protein family protein
LLILIAPGAVRVVHAAASDDVDVHRQGQRLVDEAVAAARVGQPGIEVTGCGYAGAPVEELCAESAHANLLVLGSRGRGGIRGLLLGSVSAQVAAHAGCPVPGRRRRFPRRRLAAGVAFEEAAARAMPLVAVRVWQPPRPPWHIDVRPPVLDIDELETAERTELSESIRP